MTVAIMPAIIVSVLSILRKDLVEQPAQIVDGTAFIFDGCQCRCGGRAEDRRGAVLESALQDTSGDLVGDVMNICVALCTEGNGNGFYWHVRIITLRRIAMPDNILPVFLAEFVYCILQLALFL